MERLQSIMKKLSDLGYQYEEIKPFLIPYLELIENIFLEKEQEYDYAVKLLKEELSVAGVAREICCSRTTLYNHKQLLKKYIEYSIKCIKPKNPFEFLKVVQEKNSDLDHQNQMMVIRDIRYEQLKHQNKALLMEFKEKEEEILRLQKRILDLSVKVK